IVERRAPAEAKKTGAPPAPAAEVRVQVPGRTEASGLGVAITARVLAGPLADPPLEPDGRTARFDVAQLAGPLILRRPRRGDVIYPVGMKGKKKLQDLFVDAKVARSRRATALVLDGGGHVAWVVGH